MSGDRRPVAALLGVASLGGSCRRAIHPASWGLYGKTPTFAVFEGIEFVYSVGEAELSYQLLDFFQLVGQLALKEQNPAILEGELQLRCLLLHRDCLQPLDHSVIDVQDAAGIAASLGPS